MTQEHKDLEILIDMVLGDYVGAMLDDVMIEQPNEEDAKTIEVAKSLVRACYKLGKEHNIDAQRYDVDGLAMVLGLITH